MKNPHKGLSRRWLRNRGMNSRACRRSSTGTEKTACPRIARRAVSSHTQRAGRVPYGKSRLKPQIRVADNLERIMKRLAAGLIIVLLMAGVVGEGAAEAVRYKCTFER